MFYILWTFDNFSSVVLKIWLKSFIRNTVIKFGSQQPSHNDFVLSYLDGVYLPPSEMSLQFPRPGSTCFFVFLTVNKFHLLVVLVFYISLFFTPNLKITVQK